MASVASVVSITTRQMARILDELVLGCPELAYLFRSKPGCAKTDTIGQFAQRHSLKYLSPIYLSRMANVDMTGLPDVYDESTMGDNGPEVVRRTRWATPDIYPMSENSLLCFEEADKCSPDVQKTLAGIIGSNERTIGTGAHAQRLHPTCRIILTANRRLDKCGSEKTLSHVQNRYAEFLVEYDPVDWYGGKAGDGALVVGWAQTHDMPHELIGFVRSEPSMLDDTDDAMGQGPFRSPRSVSNVGKVFRLTPEPLRLAVFTGLCGSVFASKFIGYLKFYDKELYAIPAKVFKDPATAPIPDEVPAMWALTGLLVEHLPKVEPKLRSHIFDYAIRLSEAPGRGAEFSTKLMIDLALKPEGKELVVGGGKINPKAWSWYEKNADLFKKGV